MFSFWQCSDETPNGKLLRAFKIDEADLEANRNGYLTDHQRSLLRTRNLWEIVGNIITISTIGIVIRWIILHEGAPIPEFFSVAGAVVLVLAILYFLKDQRDLFRDWQGAAVVQDSGPIRRHANKSLSIFVPSSKRSFAVSRHVYRAFRTGQTYLLYYTPRSKRLIASEWLDTT